MTNKSGSGIATLDRSRLPRQQSGILKRRPSRPGKVHGHVHCGLERAREHCARRSHRPTPRMARKSRGTGRNVEISQFCLRTNYSVYTPGSPAIKGAEVLITIRRFAKSRFFAETFIVPWLVHTRSQTWAPFRSGQQ